MYRGRERIDFENASMHKGRILIVWLCGIDYFGLTVVKNEKSELVPTRVQNSWRVCINYGRLNQATRKDHFPLSFIGQMLERLVRKSHYCFLDVFSGYFHIHIALEDQENTTFTCPFGTFAYRRTPFGLCNAPGTF